MTNSISSNMFQSLDAAVDHSSRHASSSPAAATGTGSQCYKTFYVRNL